MGPNSQSALHSRSSPPSQCRVNALDFFDAVPDSYGIDEESVGLSEDEGVVVPPLECELTEEQLGQLQSAVHPLSASNEFGIDLYIRSLECIESL